MTVRGAASAQVRHDRERRGSVDVGGRRRRHLVPLLALLGSVVGWTASGSAQPPDVQAQTTYSLAATRPKAVCVGTDSQITLSVVQHTESGALDAPLLLARGLNEEISDIIIDAEMSDRTIIELSEPTRVTGLDGTWDPPTADFKFHAKRAGTTTITFTARLAAAVPGFGLRGPARDVQLQRKVTVINCKFELTVLSKFVVEGEANLSFGNAILQVELTQSDDGQLRASNTAEWFASVSGVGDCFGNIAANQSEVAIFGTLDQDGRLSVDVKYEPFSVTLAGNCGGFSTVLTPTALHFEGPNLGFGGSQLQTLNSPFGDAPGISAYYVVPTDENELP